MVVLIADDHMVVREGLRQILLELDPLAKIYETVNGVDAFEKIKSTRFDLIILDISMPGMSGLDILQRMRDRFIKAPVLVLSVHPQEQYAIRALRLGASGYLSKDTLFEELVTAVHKIATGGRYISMAFAEKVLFSDQEKGNKEPHQLLSDREFQVFCMLAQGDTVSEIGKQLCISEKTVSTHRTRVCEKMGMKRNAELTLYAIKNNLIE